jgi:hypothetical protein
MVLLFRLVEALTDIVIDTVAGLDRAHRARCMPGPSPSARWYGLTKGLAPRDPSPDIKVYLTAADLIAQVTDVRATKIAGNAIVTAAAFFTTVAMEFEGEQKVPSALQSGRELDDADLKLDEAIFELDDTVAMASRTATVLLSYAESGSWHDLLSAADKERLREATIDAGESHQTMMPAQSQGSPNIAATAWAAVKRPMEALSRAEKLNIWFARRGPKQEPTRPGITPPRLADITAGYRMSRGPCDQALSYMQLADDPRQWDLDEEHSWPGCTDIPSLAPERETSRRKRPSS